VSGSLNDITVLVDYLKQQIREVDLVIGGMVAAENAAGVRAIETQTRHRFYEGKRAGLQIALSAAEEEASRV